MLLSGDTCQGQCYKKMAKGTLSLEPDRLDASSSRLMLTDMEPKAPSRFGRHNHLSKERPQEGIKISWLRLRSQGLCLSRRAQPQQLRASPIPVKTGTFLESQ